MARLGGKLVEFAGMNLGRCRKNWSRKESSSLKVSKLCGEVPSHFGPGSFPFDV